MALALRREHAPRVEDLRRVSILTHQRRLPHTNNPDPRTALEAKFSIQYCVARALLDGEPRLAHFDEDAVMQSDVRQVMSVTEAGPHPEMNRADQAFGAEVIVELADGRTVSERVAHMPGRGPLHPMSEDELREKFMDCAVRAIDEERAGSLFTRLVNLQDVADIREIAPMLGRA
jgi:2-methylcitrate dehydratase PrpD